MSELPPGICFDLECNRGTWVARLQGSSYPDDKIDVEVELPPEMVDEFHQKIWDVDEKIRNLKDEKHQITKEFMKKMWEMVEE